MHHTFLSPHHQTHVLYPQLFFDTLRSRSTSSYLSSSLRFSLFSALRYSYLLVISNNSCWYNLLLSSFQKSYVQYILSSWTLDSSHLISCISSFFEYDSWFLWSNYITHTFDTSSSTVRLSLRILSRHRRSSFFYRLQHLFGKLSSFNFIFLISKFHHSLIKSFF